MNLTWCPIPSRQFWDCRRWKSGLSIVIWDCGRWKSGPCLLGCIWDWYRLRKIGKFGGQTGPMRPQTWYPQVLNYWRGAKHILPPHHQDLPLLGNHRFLRLWDDLVEKKLCRELLWECSTGACIVSFHTDLALPSSPEGYLPGERSLHYSATCRSPCKILIFHSP